MLLVGEEWIDIDFLESDFKENPLYISVSEDYSEEKSGKMKQGNSEKKRKRHANVVK